MVFILNMNIQENEFKNIFVWIKMSERIELFFHWDSNHLTDVIGLLISGNKTESCVVIFQWELGREIQWHEAIPTKRESHQVGENFSELSVTNPRVAVSKTSHPVCRQRNISLLTSPLHESFA